MKKPADPVLIYDGATYQIPAPVAADLFARGVIIRDESGATGYRLSLEHAIEEIEDLGVVVARSDTPKPPRLGPFRVRNTSIFPLPGADPRSIFPATTRRIDITKDDRGR